MMIVVDMLLLALLVITAVAVIRTRSLFGAVLLMSIYSLLMAIVWYNMQAMDVAFTEAAVGAGITTVLLVGTLVYTGRDERHEQRVHWPALVICVATGAVLAYGIRDMPRFGDPAAPINGHVAPEYIEQNAPYKDRTEPGPPYANMGHHVPNQVTAVLASYRGYDTMFETAVIFTAGISLILLRGSPRAKGKLFRRRRRKETP
jgi:multicomponent Na+:H+ antiporter subunit B